MDKKKKSGLLWDREELQYTATATARSEAWKNNPTAPAFKMPTRLTKFADKKVAATPITAHNPLKPPITDGFTHRCVRNAVIKLPGVRTMLK